MSDPFFYDNNEPKLGPMSRQERAFWEVVYLQELKLKRKNVSPLRVANGAVLDRRATMGLPKKRTTR